MDIISIIRFFATFLITNSHFGELYPQGYSVLATGGMTGNALFFFCSGYTLYYSVKNSKLSTYKWFAKRVLRIYPSVWIYRLFTYIVLGYSISIMHIFQPGFWFLKAILIFYVFFYFIVRYLDDKIKYVIALLIIPFVLVFVIQSDIAPRFIMERTDNPYYLHYFYLFAIMLLGAVIAKNKSYIKLRTWDWLFLCLALILYYGYKGILIKFGLWYPQLFLPLLLALVVYYAYKTSNILINTRLFVHPKVKSFVLYVSNLTLDIYIVQFLCIDFAKKFTFPLGYSIAFVMIAVFAVLLNYLSKLVVNKLYSVLKLN